jgi:hypothetical protein
MRRVVVAAVAVIWLGIGAGAADAAIKKGRFVGQSVQGDPMGLRVDSQQRVHRFYFEEVTLDCTDNTSVDTPRGRGARFETPKSFKAPTRDRRWGIRTNNDAETGVGWQVQGRFNRKGTKTTGKLSIFALFNEEGQQDPNGSIRCEANNLRFTLKHP